MRRLTKILVASMTLSTMAPILGFASPREGEALHDLPPMQFSRAGHTLTALGNGSVLVIGGFIAEENQIAGVELFDPNQQGFRAIANAITPRHSHTATLLHDGRVLIAGGYDGRATSDTAEIFDPITATFSAIGRLSVPRANHTSVVLNDGRVVLIGGTSTDWKVLDSVEIYDPRANAFTVVGHMTVARTGNVAVLLRDGRIFIAGGSIGRGSSLAVHGTSEIFDSHTGRSMAAAGMSMPRHKHDAVRLIDGRVLVTGGSNGPDVRSDGAEIYDPTTNAFVSAATMHKPRFKHRGSSVLLSNGKVLIAGGAAQAEIYDPATNSFALLKGGSHLSGHFAAVASLPNRRVLIAGGYARPDAPTRNAWMFEH